MLLQSVEIIFLGRLLPLLDDEDPASDDQSSSDKPCDVVPHASETEPDIGDHNAQEGDWEDR